MTWHARERWIATGVLAIAAAIRLAGAAWPIIHHPDEVWQYIEPAYGMITRHAVITWEYRSNMRSWLIPSLLAGPMWLGEAIRPQGLLHLLFVRFLLAILSLSIVIFGSLIALRISRLHAIVVGLVLATAFELIYFSARALSDTISVYLFMPALWLISSPHRSTRRLAIAGLLMGLCVSTRFQLAPVLFIAAIFHCRGHLKSWIAVIGGGLAGLAIDALVDALCGQTPLLWMINNLQLNLIENRSAAFGISPPDWYLANQVRIWGSATLPVAVLAMLGARRAPSLLLLAVSNVAIHSLIPHKEYRFIFLSIVLVLLLAAIGTAEILQRVADKGAWRWWSIGGAAIVWASASAATAISAGGREQWQTFHTLIDTMRVAHAADGCGLAVYNDQRGPPAAYSLYGRDTPMLLFDGPDALTHLRSARSQYDVMIGPPVLATAFRDFRRGQCFGPKAHGGITPPPDSCVYTRPPGCTAPSDRFDINAVLARRGE